VNHYRVAVCTVTPFGPDGGLDEAALAGLIDRIASAGVGVAVGTASPGEGYSLSLPETERLFDIVRTTVDGRVPVCAMGTEPRNADQLRPTIRLAEAAKLDLMQLYTLDPGHSMKPTAGELERYFSQLLDEMSIPAAISTHAYNGLVPLPVLARLLDNYPNIATIHCTSEVNYLSQLLALVDGRAEVLVGGPMQALSVRAMGGNGFLCSEGNLVPTLCGEVQAAIHADDTDAIAASYSKLVAVFGLNIWPGGTVRFLKRAMQLLGVPGGHARPPFELLDDAQTAILRDAMRSLDIAEWDVR
jgi:4-hydroxy-tetrahydrodipicolinate synthase